MTKQSTELAIVEQLNINGMDKPAAQKLLDAYGVPFTEAGKLIEQGRAITVTSEEDTENMALARKTRLELRTQRIAIEKKHDELKADSLAYGKQSISCSVWHSSRLSRSRSTSSYKSNMQKWSKRNAAKLESLNAPPSSPSMSTTYLFTITEIWATKRLHYCSIK